MQTVNVNSFFYDRLLLAVLCTFLFNISGYTQDQNIDSLKQVSASVDNKEKSKIFNLISRAYWQTSIDSAAKYAQLAYQISMEEDLVIENLNALNNLGVICDFQGNYSLSLSRYFNIISLAQEKAIYQAIVPNSYFLSIDKKHENLDSLNIHRSNTGIPLNSKISANDQLAALKIVANAYVNIGIVYGRLSQFEKSLVSFQQSLNIRNSINDETGKGVVLFNLGTVYLKLSRPDLAQLAYKESIAIRIKTNNKQGIANGYMAMGELYKANENLDSAYYYLSKAKTAYQELNNTRGVAQTKTFLGEVYSETNKPLKAIDNLRQALVIRRNLGDREGVAIVNEKLGKVYENLNDFNKALSSFEASYQIGKELGNNNLVAEALIGLSRVYEKQNINTKAFEAFKEYHATQKIISEQKFNSTIAQYQTLYQVEAIDKENIILKRENDLKRLELKRQKNIQAFMVIIWLVVLFSGVSLFMLYRSILRSNKKLLLLNADLEKNVAERTKDLREALKIADESNNLKNSFLSNISHEIRTPLNGIMGFSSLLSAEIQSNSDGHRFIQEITNSSNRLMHLLNNLIDISRAESNSIRMRMIPCSINNAINEALKINETEAREQEVALKHDLLPLPELYADWDNLVRVFSIIINNSIKYSPKGTVSVASSYNSSNGVAEISITDTGIGIEPDYLPFVFEPFMQESAGLSRSFQGAGLGLPLAKRLLSIMGGSIDVSSRKGFGTVVNVEFVVSEKDEGKRVGTTRTRTQKNIVAKAHKARVLIIEGNSYTRFYLQALLRRYANVTVARDGNEALSVLDDSVNYGTLFDLIIVDSQLPEPWSPESLLSEIHNRKDDYRKRALAVQVDPSQEEFDEKTWRSVGYKHVVYKPIDKDKLLGLLKDISLLRNSKSR